MNASSRRWEDRRVKKAGLFRVRLMNDPGSTYFRAFDTIIGPASLTFVFGMGTRVSLQVNHRETARSVDELGVVRISK